VYAPITRPGHQSSSAVQTRIPLGLRTDGIYYHPDVAAILDAASQTSQVEERLQGAAAMRQTGARSGVEDAVPCDETGGDAEGWVGAIASGDGESIPIVRSTLSGGGDRVFFVLPPGSTQKGR
jgi:hypothetical protein